MGFAVFATFAGFDALADRAGLKDRATFASCALGVVRAALATLPARAARAALEAFAFFVIFNAAFADFADIFADFFADLFADFLADLLADFEGPAGFVDFAAAPRAAFAPRFVPLVASRFFGTVATDSLPPTAAPSNETCGKPQPISNCSAMRR